MRTSITFPEPLLCRLKITLAEQKKTMVAFVVEQVEKGLVASKEARKKSTYIALNRLTEAGTTDQTDIASTINETLYETKVLGEISMSNS